MTRAQWRELRFVKRHRPSLATFEAVGDRRTIRSLLRRGWVCLVARHGAQVYELTAEGEARLRDAGPRGPLKVGELHAEALLRWGVGRSTYYLGAVYRVTATPPHELVEACAHRHRSEVAASKCADKLLGRTVAAARKAQPGA